MTTIEERADMAIYKPNNGHIPRSFELLAFARGYELGATEQKAIDIDKACKWITEHIDLPYEGEFIDNEPIASDYIDWCKKRIEDAKEITDEFRKAMEE